MQNKNIQLSFLIILLVTSSCGYYSSLRKGKVKTENQVHSMPMTYENGLLFVEVWINDQKKRFIIDSGAPSVVDDDISKALNLKKVLETGFKDSGGGSSRNKIVKVNSFKFADVEIKNTVAAVIDFDRFGCYDIDGILGTNILRLFDWKLDFVNKKVVFYAPSQTDAIIAKEGFTQSLPLTINKQFTPYIDVKHKDKVFKAKFDLGSTKSVSLPSEFMETDTLKHFVFGEVGKGAFSKTIDTTFYFYSNDIQLGDVELDHMFCSVSSKTNHGWLGTRSIENSVTLISWSKKKMFIKPHHIFNRNLPYNQLYFDQDINDQVYIKAKSASDIELFEKISINAIVTKINGHVVKGNLCELEQITNGQINSLELNVNDQFKTIKFNSPIKAVF